MLHASLGTCTPVCIYINTYMCMKLHHTVDICVCILRRRCLWHTTIFFTIPIFISSFFTLTPTHLNTYTHIHCSVFPCVYLLIYAYKHVNVLVFVSFQYVFLFLIDSVHKLLFSFAVPSFPCCRRDYHVLEQRVEVLLDAIVDAARTTTTTTRIRRSKTTG